MTTIMVTTGTITVSGAMITGVRITTIPSTGRTITGTTSIVSLGRTSLLEDLNLKVGDSIQAIGQKGMINGKTVFVANNFKAKGQTVANRTTVEGTNDDRGAIAYDEIKHPRRERMVKEARASCGRRRMARPEAMIPPRFIRDLSRHLRLNSSYRADWIATPGSITT